MSAVARIRRLSRAQIAAVVAFVVLSVFCILAALVPSTSSAFVAKIANSTDTAATAASFTCTGAVTVDATPSIFAWKLNEASGSTTAADFDSGLYPGSYRGTMTTSTTTPLACPRDPAGAYVLNGTNAYVTSGLLQINPQTFSEEVWFKSTVASGKLMGFGNATSGASTQYDRHVYFATTGQLIFGTYNAGTQIITSPKAYNDGAWHQVVATMSPSTGMRLYVDGSLVVSNSAYTAAEVSSGYWRFGYDAQSGWPSIGANNFFTGSMRFASVYSTALTAAQVSAHYVAGQ